MKTEISSEAVEAACDILKDEITSCDSGETEREVLLQEAHDFLWQRHFSQCRTPSHYEYQDGGKKRVFDDPPDPNRGDRCPICYWALYDGDWCQGPDWCANRGKSVENPIHLTNEEAAKLIEQNNPTGDERMIKAAKIVCLCALGILVLLLISLLSGCANADRALWDLLGRIQTP